MGIGEVRWALIDDGEIVEASISLDGTIPAGTIVEGKLIDVGRDGRNAVALADGQEYLLPEAPPNVTEGALFEFEVTRERIPWTEP